MVAIARQLEAKNVRVPVKLRCALRLRKRNRTHKVNTDFWAYISGVLGQEPFITDEKEQRAPQNSGARGEWTIGLRQCHAEPH